MNSKRSGGESSSSPSRPSADERGRYLIKPQSIRSDTVRNGGLIVVGIYMVQSLLAITPVDVAARISTVAWAVAIPLLAALVMLNVTHESYRYASFPPYLIVIRTLAQVAAIVGVVAGFWHIWFPAGIVVMFSAAVAFAFVWAYSRRLDQDNRES
jgi:hypothetical protein